MKHTDDPTEESDSPHAAGNDGASNGELKIDHTSSTGRGTNRKTKAQATTSIKSPKHRKLKSRFIYKHEISVHAPRGDQPSDEPPDQPPDLPPEEPREPLGESGCQLSTEPRPIPVEEVSLKASDTADDSHKKEGSIRLEKASVSPVEFSGELVIEHHPKRQLGHAVIEASGLRVKLVSLMKEMPEEKTEPDGATPSGSFLQAGKERLAQIFAPVESSEEGGGFDFESFLSDGVSPGMTAEFSADGGKRTEIKNSNRYRAGDIIADAIKTDPEIGSIIRRFTSILPEESKSGYAADVLRKNAKVRIELGKHFITKFKRHLGDLPERVRLNKVKNPAYQGYPKIRLTSSEYVPLLAVSMLDGTFDYEAEKVMDQHIRDKSDRSEDGQHREAARILLARA